MKVQKKSPLFDGVRFDGGNRKEVLDFLNGGDVEYTTVVPNNGPKFPIYIVMETGERIWWVSLEDGDWIVATSTENFFVVRKEEFERDYVARGMGAIVFPKDMDTLLPEKPVPTPIVVHKNPELEEIEKPQKDLAFLATMVRRILDCYSMGHIPVDVDEMERLNRLEGGL